MKASKLIGCVKKLIEEHGDLDVVIVRDGDGSQVWIDHPTVVDSSPEELNDDGFENGNDDEPVTEQVIAFYV